MSPSVISSERSESRNLLTVIPSEVEESNTKRKWN